MSVLALVNMRTWREVRAVYKIRTNISPVMHEIKGKKVIFWFKNGNGAVADIVTELKVRGANVCVLWNEEEGLTGIEITRQ